MGCKVLVADDEACITHVVARKFQNAGLEVIVAMDGCEAYERATAERPDFLVTDLQMPGMSGLELCARLTAELPEPIPTILLTAKGFEIDRDQIRDLPILHVMTKPFSPRELLANVQHALGVGAPR
ncbi:MAG TPA: response regulator [Phycisphaerae bacterium]|nr:response regulator [Phycisphaerae bacterium]